MYKKIIGVATVAMLAIGVFVATNTNAANDNTVDLKSLLNVNVANAECRNNGAWLDGHCLGIEQCVYGGSDCSFGG